MESAVRRDRSGAPERSCGGGLRAGVPESPPWTEVADSGRPAGVEVELVEGFAERLDAEVVRSPGAESHLIRSLEGGDLDVVVAGRTGTSPGRSTPR